MPATPTPSNPDSPTPLIVVMGVSGSGKSTLATKIAHHYHYTYLDADDFHSPASIAHMASGLPLTDEMRRPWIASICQRLQQALTQHEAIVLAFSGLRLAHRQLIRNQSLKTLVLFLNGDEALVQLRANTRHNHFMNPGLVHSQFEALEHPTNESDVIAININATPEQIFDQSVVEIDRALNRKT